MYLWGKVFNSSCYFAVHWRAHILETFVARPLVKLQALLFIGVFILGRNHINVMYVARPLIRLRNLDFIREFILERNHINVICVERPSVEIQAL